MHAKTTLLLLAVTTLSVSSLGCAKDDDEEAATATVTSALQASQQGGITQDIVDVSSEETVSAEKAASTLATKDAAGIQPAGCMTRTQSGTSVHIVFAGCTGPFGKVRLDGSADVTFSKDPAGRIVADVASGNDLRANDRALHYKARATIVFSGDVRHVTWHADASGQTKRGRDYSRSTDLAFDFDTKTRCIDGSGVANGTVAGIDLEMTVDNLAVCAHTCPKAGSMHATLRGKLGRERSVDVAFDGSDQAHVKTNKRSFDVALACDDGEAAD